MAVLSTAHRVDQAASEHRLMMEVERIRLLAAEQLDQSMRGARGQFFTPFGVASLIASLSTLRKPAINVLDAGAGVGVLTAAWVKELCRSIDTVREVNVVAFERDESLVPYLTEVLELCRNHASLYGIELRFEVRLADFIEAAAEAMNGDLFREGDKWQRFDVAVMNPPYKKFRTDSAERRVLSGLGLETSNLYTAFVALAVRGLNVGGELIAITPRSFCNGPYFTPFRKELLSLCSLTHLHVFDSRDVAFGEDEVLQENIIFRVERSSIQAEQVCIEWSESGDSTNVTRRIVPFENVVRPTDRDSFIHIIPDEWGSSIASMVENLAGTLASLGIQASTGRVVDFRVKEYLRADAELGTVPLLYPAHLVDGRVQWPKVGGKKPNAIIRSSATETQLNSSGHYVLVKRFSSKEERRRVVAAVLSPTDIPDDVVGLENHLNYYHENGHGLSAQMAFGLAAFLNSTLVDTYFRQFNGHTQVNATDLRKLHYPTQDQLFEIADAIDGQHLEQAELDAIVEHTILGITDVAKDDVNVQKRIAEASAILTALGLPKEQTNERAALTLLALVDIKPSQDWSQASNPLRGVTPIMSFVGENYGKMWAPNTRETVRRFTLHQFQDAGVVVPNPDKPSRPVNSPSYCYQVPTEVLELLRSYGGSKWKARLADYLASAGTLSARYASERAMSRLPLNLAHGKNITLSPGGQNDLIVDIVNEFCERFTPGGVPLYIGDADAKWAVFEGQLLSELGVTVDSHGKMPDVVVHFTAKNWLVLIEAVTSHGPVNAKRRAELKVLFEGSTAPLVYVTAFKNRTAMNKYLPEIAWETEVWVADAPSHLIHFNGERFLGPYAE